MKRFNLLLAFGLLLSVFSCRRPDEQSPTITMLKPASMAEFNIYDYVPLSAKVSDDRRIDFIKVDLVDSDYKIVENMVSFFPNSSELLFDEVYHLDDLYLESGNYYVKVSTSDGVNTSVAYRQIKINGIARILKRIYVLDSALNTVNVSTVNGAGTVFEYAVNTDYNGAVFSDYHQYIAISGKTTGSLMFIDTVGNLIWSDPIQQNPPFSYFNHITYDYQRNLTFISYSTRIVRGVRPVNNVIFGMNLPGQAQAVGSWSVGSNHIIMQFRDYTQPRQLALVNYGTATLQQISSLNFNIKEAFEKSTNEYLLFGDEAGQGVIRNYFAVTNNMSIPANSPIGVINSVAKVSNTEYILGMTSGLYRYVTTSGSVTPLVTGVNFRDVVYNDLNDVVVCAVGSEIRSYSRFGSLLGTVNHNTTIVKVLLNFNK
ncbi:MAG: hypothetical protein ACK4K0_11030 [Flavobacteriales bacterium]